ncbi:MAG: DUF1080 domain-containing protein [Verrucomicrobia bacterium]|nr:DUF1080 domain-containing protein [Verrucomicrobiota bacterium]
MQKLLALALPVTAGLLVSCSSPNVEPVANTVDLFNGRDLSNWKAVLAKPDTQKEDVFSVHDGVIVCRGEPLGFIETEQTFTNFKLTVEWRWAPGTKPGNSGVFLRINGDRKPLPRCIECQLKSGDAGDVYGFHGMKIDGDAARRVEKKGHELGGDFVGVKKRLPNENPPGQWNRYDLVLNGGKLSISVNGVSVNEAVDCETVAGPIGLQSEGGVVHFRRVRLTPLP